MNNITEINIIGEGMQLKQILEENYTYTGLAKRFGLDRDTLIMYLGKKVIDIGTFKEQLEDLFQKPFHQIVTPVEEQVKEYILTIKKNIKQYKTADDVEVLTELNEFAMKYCQPYEQLMAKGSLAICKYNTGFHKEAIPMMQEVVDSSIEEDFKELIAYYSVHFAYFFLGSDKNKSRRILKNAETIIDDEASQSQLSKLTLFNYYHFYGVTLRRWGKHKEAREKFEKAAECAEDDSKVARASSNIALSYQEEGKFNPAKQWYYKALDKAQQYPNIKSGILNNLATLFLSKGMNLLAAESIKIAMEMITSESDPSRKIAIYDTYLDIHGKNGEKLLKDIITLLDQYVVFSEDEQYLVTCLEKILSHLMEDKSHETIQHLVNKIMRYSRIEGEKRPLNDLKAVAVNSMHFLEDEDCFELKAAFKKPPA